MKRIISLVFLICFISSFAQAYEKGAGFYAEYGKDFTTDVTYTDLEVHYIFKFWEIELIPYGGTQTWFISDNTLIFGGKPFLDVYSWGIKTKWNNIIFQYEHFCAHPVMTDYIKKREGTATTYTVKDGMMGGNSDRFSVRYQYN